MKESRGFLFQTIVLLVSICCLTACDSSDTGKTTETANVESSPEQVLAPDNEPDDHKFMVQLLAQITKEARPDENYHLNAAKAKQLKIDLDGSSDSTDRVRLQFARGKQLLYAGQVDEAILILKGVVESLGGVESALKPNTKQLLDYLALAYLRKGEQENCIAIHNDESCIIPLSEKALHTHKEGSQKAIELYEKIMQRFPTDMQTRYLAALARMTLGDASQLLKLDKFEAQPKLQSSWKNIATSLGIGALGIAGGCAVDDFNNDGHLDIIASSYRYKDQLRYFENSGRGGFVDKTADAKLLGITGGININHLDYNNDGNLDIWIMRGGWLHNGGRQPNGLLRGNGDGSFHDVTRSAGLLSRHPTQTSVWADFNLDGHLDVFVGNETSQFKYGEGTEGSQMFKNPCELFVNNGDGTFTEKAEASGVDVIGFVKGVTAADFNNDGYPDLYLSVVNDRNIFLQNKTSDGQLGFENRTQTAGVDRPRLSFPTWTWDFDNDGHEDIFVAAYNLPNMSRVGGEYVREKSGSALRMVSPALYRNLGDGTFTHSTTRSGLNKSMFAMGCNFGDLDNDGFLDFYVGTGAPDLRSIVPNRMFRNVAGATFEEVTFEGFAHIQKGHGVGWGDMDCDGDEDIYIVMGGAFEGDVAQNALFENPGNDHEWIVLELEGKQSNRAAVGVRVEIVVNESGKTRSVFRTVGTGANFGSNSLHLEVGLGKSDSIEVVRIRWPRKDQQSVEIKGLPMKTKVLIVEGSEDQWQQLEYEATPFAVN